MYKLLLVEDNELNRDILGRLLQRHGYEVILAEDGAQALEMAAKGAPDLILMDIGLPVLDGYEATRRLRASPATAALPIIALTAHAMESDRVAALTSGFDDFATKPIHLQALLDKIRRFLKPAPPGPTEESSAEP